MGTVVTDQPLRIAGWVAKKVGQETSWGDFYALGVERDGEIVAGVVLNNFNGVNATAHIAIEKPGKDMLHLFRVVSDYAFRHAGLKRLTGMVPASSTKVLDFDLRIGFAYECTMQGAAQDGGDMHVLVMWARTCPWLKKD